MVRPFKALLASHVNAAHNTNCGLTAQQSRPELSVVS